MPIIMFVKYRYMYNRKESKKNQKTERRLVENRSPTIPNVLNLAAPSTDNFKCVTYKGKGFISTPICVYEADDDQIISANLIRGKVWQSDLVSIFRLILNADPELDFVDLGANLGLWTVVALGLGRRVIAVEPFPPTAHRLRRTLQLGHFEPRVTLVTSPLSNVYQDVVFEMDGKNIGGTRIKDSRESSVKDEQRKLIKRTATMDDLARIIPASFTKAFMKMDIEGSELKALNKSDKFLEVVNVPVITLEWRFFKSKVSSPEVRYFEAWFTRMGYKPYLMTLIKKQLKSLSPRTHGFRAKVEAH
ncbi:uncharacterized protein LOC106151433 [Lingula anatina]|uniref:Uncharacterized protein LOC106151433 n=1 Tax=Lingula anatina TaxID=7574 RepID=A0A1S3H299_LINAN|nr:uncharacterized protein LOC106151433 [Lingula anatina]|eukprot:XP_013380138.1 uncharacterized protein LOC106151433 [Lingula anatina]